MLYTRRGARCALGVHLQRQDGDGGRSQDAQTDVRGAAGCVGRRSGGRRRGGSHVSGGGHHR